MNEQKDRNTFLRKECFSTNNLSYLKEIPFIPYINVISFLDLLFAISSHDFLFCSFKINGDFKYHKDNCTRNVQWQMD